MNRGYFGIGIFQPKKNENIGVLWRSAFIMNASFIYTIGDRSNFTNCDTTKSWKHIPFYNFKNLNDFYSFLPYKSKLIGVELDNRSIPLEQYNHPERSVYILGAEDYGLTDEIRDKCHDLVILPGEICLNVSVAGSIVLYDRLLKNKNK